MPTSSKTDTSAIHRVLLDSGADPKLIHPAIEELSHLSGQNVITAIGAQITELRTELRSEMQAQIAELRSEMQAEIGKLRSEMQVEIGKLRSEMQAEINDLRVQISGFHAEMKTLNKVIWLLASLLFIPMFSMLYKILAQ